MWRKLPYILALLACLPMCGCRPRVKYKYRIAVIPKGLTHEHWQSVHRGALRAAEDLKAEGINVEILWEGPAQESEAQPQINIVNKFVARRVSGIVLAPQHSQLMVRAVRDAGRDGIPVVIIDSDLEDRESYIKYVATDNYRGGRMAAERLLEVLKKDGKEAPNLVMFRYAPNSESTEQRERGFSDVVEERIAAQKKAGQPTITWVSKDEYLGSTRDEAQKKASTPLSRNIDRIDGIFAPNESSTAGVLQVLRGLKSGRKVRLVGFDSSEELQAALRSGEVDGLVIQDPYRMGYLGVWALVQHLEGKDAFAGRKYVPTGEHMMTKENVDTASTRERFDPDLQAQRSTESLRKTGK